MATRRVRLAQVEPATRRRATAMDAAAHLDNTPVMFDVYAALGPVVRALPPERAHRLGVWALKRGLVPRPPLVQDPRLAIERWGLRFDNPVGLAAGFDKDAEVYDPVLRQGMGFVEIGTVTPEPQGGNPKPRLFRLPEHGAVINRLGFNNHGIEAAKRELLKRQRGEHGVVGVNIGKNKTSTDAVADYRRGARELGPLADYLVVNVSSPNTPGLRALQEPEALRELLDAVRGELSFEDPPPLLLKIAPDLTDEDLDAIADVVKGGGADGLIVSNTTIERPDAIGARWKDEAGGLSGKPLLAMSTRVLSAMYERTGKQVPLVGVGGVSDAESAYAKIRAGACLVQLYTALIYNGMSLVTQINQGLIDLLDRDGFATLEDAIGADHT